MKIEIRFEPETEDIVLIPEKEIAKKEVALSISGFGLVSLIDYESAMKKIDFYGPSCKAEMIGKSDYILIYDCINELKLEDGRYILEDYLIMKNDNGLKCIGEDELSQVIKEFKSHIVKIKMGFCSISGYQLG